MSAPKAITAVIFVRTPLAVLPRKLVR